MSVDLEGVDLDRYDFDGLRNDIASIIDVQSAVLTTLKWSLLLPFIGTIVAWTVFDGRMPNWVLVPWIAVLIATMALSAVNVGLLLVLRNRIDETNQAAERVLEMTASMHTDYLKVRSGETDVPMKEVAGVLTRELVFPALFAGGHNAVAAATTATGPVGWIGARLLKYPLAAVEKRVLEVLDSPELDSPGPDTARTEIASNQDASTDAPTDADQPIDTVVPAEAELGEWYAKTHEIVNRVVGGVSTIATGSLGTVLFFATLPFLGWLAFGWYVL